MAQAKARSVNRQDKDKANQIVLHGVLGPVELQRDSSVRYEHYLALALRQPCH